MMSIEKKESEKEKLLKEAKQDAKDISVVKRSQRNGMIQNDIGARKYSENYGRRIMHDETYNDIPRREDKARPYSIPLGFTRYRTKDLDLTKWIIVYFMGWRIALPKYMSDPAKREILRKIYQWGPSSVGYTVYGDTLMPLKMLVSNRATLNSL